MKYETRTLMSEPKRTLPPLTGVVRVRVCENAKGIFSAYVIGEERSQFLAHGETKVEAVENLRLLIQETECASKSVDEVLLRLDREFTDR